MKPAADKLPFKTINDAWAFYWRHLLPALERANLPTRVLMFAESMLKRSFFCGAASFFDIQIHLMDDTGNPDEVTPADLKLMDDLHAEIDAYVAELLALVKTEGTP